MDINQQPHVSVIIPIYNRAHLLNRSLNSVLAQTVQNIEILVIDDHSDESLELQIAKYNDPRIRLLRLPDRSGVSFARNVGIEKSKAPLVAFLDSDDSWKEKKLQKQLDFMEKNPLFRVVHTEEIWIRNGTRVNPRKHHRKSGGNIFYRSLHLCLISPSTVLIRRSVFDEYGLFDTSLPVCEDYDFWLRIISKEEVGFIDEPLISKYGGHDDQLSTAYPAMDRYRIQSMIKLLSKCPLSKADQKEICRVIHQKATILLQGALKRDLPEADLYQQWIDMSHKGHFSHIST